jgi:predicted NBD/HSP70 family sugar kinase
MKPVKRNHKPSFTAAMPSDIKPINRMKIINVFRTNGEFSVNDISEKTGISRLTIKKTIMDLQMKGIIQSVGKGNANGGGGPRPELFKFYSVKQNFCLYMEGGNLNAAICDLQNNILAKICVEFGSVSLEKFLSLVNACWESLSKECGITKKQIYGVILACSGIVDNKQKVLVHRAESGHWGANIPFGLYLKEQFPDAEIIIESCTRMAGISEIINCDNVIKEKRLITINTDTGISSCLIDNRNAGGSPTIEVGELGHIMVEPNDAEQCGCGSHGCLEIMVSERRILQLLKERTKEKKTSFPPEKITLFDVFDAANKGDMVAQELVDYIAQMFFYAIRNLLMLLRAETIIFQGTYTNAGAYFFEKLHGYLVEQPFHLRQNVPEIICDKHPLSEILLNAVSSTISSQYFSEIREDLT